jgi:hypothetical protein
MSDNSKVLFPKLIDEIIGQDQSSETAACEVGLSSDTKEKNSSTRKEEEQ